MEMHECGRCGRVDIAVRMTLVNHWREERELGRVKPEGVEYGHGYRCPDKDACLERFKAQLARGAA
jgi:hypothetical protein